MDEPTVSEGAALVKRATFAFANEAFTDLFDSLLQQQGLGPDEQATLARYLAGSTEEPTPEILAKRDELANFINAWKAREAFLLDEEERIAGERRQVRRLIGYFEEGIHAQFLNWGIKRLAGATHSYAVKSNPPSVEIVDPKLIPRKYYTKPAPVISKQLVKDALADGKKVPGAQLITTKTRIEVR